MAKPNVTIFLSHLASQNRPHFVGMWLISIAGVSKFELTIRFQCGIVLTALVQTVVRSINIYQNFVLSTKMSPPY